MQFPLQRRAELGECLDQIYLFRIEQPLRLETVERRDDPRAQSIEVDVVTDLPSLLSFAQRSHDVTTDVSIALDEERMQWVFRQEVLGDEHGEELRQAGFARAVFGERGEPIEHAEPTVAEDRGDEGSVPLASMTDDCLEELLLASEVVEEPGLRDADLIRNRREARPPVACPDEGLRGDVDDLKAPKTPPLERLWGGVTLAVDIVRRRGSPGHPGIVPTYLAVSKEVWYKRASTVHAGGRRNLADAGKYLHRYSPLVILGVIQLVVILLAPSTPISQTAGGADVAGENGEFLAGTDEAAGGVSGDAADAGGGSKGRVGGSSDLDGATPGLQGPGSVSAAGKVTACPGNQPAPFMYMPPCLKFTGRNGGATMPGVTDKEIRYVWYENVINPALAAVGAQTGLSYTKEQLCQALKAFTNTLNKRFQLYGRKFVSLDGPGSHSGYNQTGEGSCQYPYYQADSCGTSDAACYRAQADVIASMKPRPAFVIGTTQVQVPFIDQLWKHKIPVMAQGFQDAIHDARAPYVWEYQMSLENTTSFGAEYFCRKLIGKPVRYAGAEVLASGSNPTKPPERRLGLLYPVTTPDATSAAANGWLTAIRKCGGTAIKYPYASNADTLAQEMSTIAAKMRVDRTTTVYAFSDFLAPVPLSNALEGQNWHPEFVISGAFAIDNELLAQLYNPRVWRYAFGIALRGAYRYPPGPKYDYYKAYKDGGGPGEPFPLSSAGWPFFRLAGTMFHQGGPSPNLATMRAGMFGMSRRRGTFDQGSFQWGVGSSKYFGLRDVAEVWYCPSETSKVNGRKGRYMGVGDYRRFEHGQFDSTMRVFPNGPCSAS